MSKSILRAPNEGVYFTAHLLTYMYMYSYGSYALISSIVETLQKVVDRVGSPRLLMARCSASFRLFNTSITFSS